MRKITIKDFDAIMCANDVKFLGGGFTHKRRLEETFAKAHSLSTDAMPVRRYIKKSYGLASDGGSILDHKQKHDWLYCWLEDDILIHEAKYEGEHYNYCVYKIVK